MSYASDQQYVDELQARIRELVAERDALRAALRKYGNHLGWVNVTAVDCEREPCTCGYVAALRGEAAPCETCGRARDDAGYCSSGFHISRIRIGAAEAEIQKLLVPCLWWCDTLNSNREHICSCGRGQNREDLERILSTLRGEATT